MDVQLDTECFGSTETLRDWIASPSARNDDVQVSAIIDLTILA
jgi:hypothetical protein